MTLSAPDHVCLRLVWERREGEAGVGETYPVGFFAENLIGGFDDDPLVLGNRLSASLLDALLNNQAMHFSHNQVHGALSLLKAIWSLVAHAI